MSRNMQLHCVVEGCSTKPANLPVFAFPRCIDSQKLWKKALGIREEIRSTGGVCTLHFEEAFLIRDENEPSNVWLMPGAIPDMFPDSLRTLASYPGHCRMCGMSQKKSLNNKVSVLRRDIHVLPVLDICLELENPVHSLLPDGVCEGCTSMVRFITRFTKSCWNAQNLLIERYAPGRDCKVEPWKRVSQYSDETTLIEVIPVGEDFEEIDNSVQNITPKQELNNDTAVKQELQLQVDPADEFLPSVIEPKVSFTEETSEVLKLPYKPPRVSKPKASRKSPKSSSPTATAKRSRTSEGGGNAAATASELYGCDFCVLKFATKRLLDQHIRTHVRSLHEAERKRLFSVQQFRCLRCRAQFRRPEELKEHFTQQHRDKIECRFCNITFKYDSLLDKHNAKMHPDRMLKTTKQEPNNESVASV